MNTGLILHPEKNFSKVEMDIQMHQIVHEVFEKCGLEIANFQVAKESKAYDASRFDLNGKRIRSRSSKITAKKEGQFVFPKSVLISKGIISTK